MQEYIAVFSWQEMSWINWYIGVDLTKIPAADRE
jgi:hypothetical protein